MTKKRLRVVFFGPHGAGKRTQAEQLAEAFSVPFLSSGTFLQEEITAQTAIGKLVRQYVEQGMLVPDDLVNAVIMKKIRRLVTQEKGFVLDGYPRNVEQAGALEKVAKLSAAVHLRMSDEAAWERVQLRRECCACRAVYHLEARPPGELETCTRCGHGVQGRPTDAKEAFFSRQAVYHFMTEPLVSFYRQRGLLLSIKGDRPMDEVARDIERGLTRRGFHAS